MPQPNLEPGFDEMQPIGPEVKRQLEEILAKAGDTQHPGWTEEDLQKLQAELESLPFDEALRTQFDPPEPEPFKQVVFNGVLTNYHRVNNFPHLFDAAVTAREGVRTNSIFEHTYTSPEYHMPQIFDELQATYPMLYRKMKEVTGAMKARGLLRVPEDHRVITPEERADAAVCPSVIFTAVVKIARQIDPSYDVGHFIN